MIEPSWIIGFDQKGVFWTNTIKVFLVKMRYELKDFIAPDGSVIIPMSDKSWNLVEHYKEAGEKVYEETAFQLKEAELYALEINKKGLVYLLHNENSKNYISKVPLPKPTKGYTVFCASSQDLGMALTIASSRFKDYKELLEFLNTKFFTGLSLYDDIYHVEYKDIENLPMN